MKPEKDEEVDHDVDKKDLDANLPPLRNRNRKAATGRGLAVPALRMALTKKIKNNVQLSVDKEVLAAAKSAHALTRVAPPLVPSEVPSWPDHKD